MEIKTFVGWILLSTVCLAFANESKATPTFTIDGFCGQRLVLVNDAFLKITNLAIDKTCVVTIHTAYTHERYKLRARLQKRKLIYSDKCKKVSMDFFDGPTLNKHYKLSGDVCSRSQVYETTNTYLTMNIMAKEQIIDDDDILILVSAFHTGPCTDSEFQCSNKRCINNALVCNGHDDCGDDSEEHRCTYIIMAWVVVVVVLLCLFSVCACVTCVCCKLCRRKRYEPLIKRDAVNELPSYSRIDPYQLYQPHQPILSPPPYQLSSAPPMPPTYRTAGNKN